MLLIIIILIIFMQGVSNYIPSRVYKFTALLWLQYMIHVLLFPITKFRYFYISASGSMCAVPSMACFCSSVMLCCPGTFVIYFLNNFWTVPVASILIGINFVLYIPLSLILLLLM